MHASCQQNYKYVLSGSLFGHSSSPYLPQCGQSRENGNVFWLFSESAFCGIHWLKKYFNMTKSEKVPGSGFFFLLPSPPPTPVCLAYWVINSLDDIGGKRSTAMLSGQECTQSCSDTRSILCQTDADIGTDRLTKDLDQSVHNICVEAWVVFKQ